MMNDYTEYDDDSLESVLQNVEEEIQEWIDDNVYPGDQGFQDMLQTRDAIIEEQERRKEENDN